MTAAPYAAIDSSSVAEVQAVIKAYAATAASAST